MIILAGMKRTGKIALSAIAGSCGTSLSTVYRVMRGESKAGNPMHESVRKHLFETGHFAGRISPVMLVVRDRKLFVRYKHGDLLIDALLERGTALGIDFMATDRANLTNDLARWRPAGVIALDPERLPAGIPAVNLNHYPRTGGVFAVCRNSQRDFENILRKLREGGYRKVGLFVPVSDVCTTWFSRNSGLVDFQKAFEMAGMDWNEKFVFCRRTSTETHFESCAACAQYFTSLPETPEVLLLFSGVYISAVSSEFRRLGRRMRFASPDEWRYNIDPFDFPADELALMNGFPADSMAEAALELLTGQIRDPHVPPRLIMLESKVKIFTSFHGADKN